MAETVETGNTAEQPERTFTQSELDAIVGERLRREKEKYSGFEDYKAKAEKYDAAEEASKSDLQKANELASQYKSQLEALQNEINTRNAREKVALEKGIPASLLSGSTEEECTKQADELLKWHSAKPSNYPNVRDAGEVQNKSGGKTRDQFADWFNQTMK